MFAYRDAVQESTGYTPFELACTHEVKAPLDVLRNTWVPTAGLDEDIAEYVGQVHARMKEISEEVQKNLNMAQKQQKHWYDKRSRKRELKAGEQVLLLLPDSTSKFRCPWRGPYTVTKSTGKVTYEVKMPNGTKIFYINLLKHWIAREEACYINIIHGSEDIGEYRWTQEPTQYGPQLSEVQRQEVEHLLKKFPKVIAGRPGLAKSISIKY